MNVTDVIKVGLVFSIFNFFITKPSLANKWTRKKIPSCSNLDQKCHKSKGSVNKCKNKLLDESKNVLT